MQGIGNALFEEMLWTRTGCSLNDNLLEYRIPIDPRTCPRSSTCIIVENGDGPGPFGAKGCGEGAFAGVIGAIATAVADAGVPDDRAAADAGARVARIQQTSSRRRRQA